MKPITVPPPEMMFSGSSSKEEMLARLNSGELTNSMYGGFPDAKSQQAAYQAMEDYRHDLEVNYLMSMDVNDRIAAVELREQKRGKPATERLRADILALDPAGLRVQVRGRKKGGSLEDLAHSQSYQQSFLA